MPSRRRRREGSARPDGLPSRARAGGGGGVYKTAQVACVRRRAELEKIASYRQGGAEDRMIRRWTQRRRVRGGRQCRLGAAAHIQALEAEAVWSASRRSPGAAADVYARVCSCR
jgi:hypothetical protein